MDFGVCYYPEHWPEDRWAQDAAQMRETGISVVRMGEFAWSLFEPERDVFHWDWLGKAIDVLAGEGLKVILGTPTAAPPKWLIDERTDILAYDSQGRPRQFGSRRHYCFSSSAYRDETVRIVTKMAERFGLHDSVIGWQTDNEFGCHDTVRSYSPAATMAFREWLAEKYTDIDCLNQSWGGVFWSQLYRDFAEIDLPNLTVTEPNPSHVLDFFRFSSDQVLSYHRVQVDILKSLSPGRPIYHNVMGHFTDFDHFALGAEVDVMGWDNYPLGFLDQEPYADNDKRRYLRQGHPDFAAFHHDLYRACAPKWGVLEQQPGPVNWAPHNPAPLPGMVRLWLHEAAAHGADIGSVFRWRQAPFAQEQCHAGLLRSDGMPAPGLSEVKQCVEEQISLTPDSVMSANVALLFDYETQWMSECQPQGDWSYLMMAMGWYGVARSLGLNVDIVRMGQDISNYALVLTPSLFHITPPGLQAFKQTEAALLFGPRSGSKTAHFSIPDELAPGPLQALFPAKVVRSESLPDWWQATGLFAGETVTGRHWLDHIEGDVAPLVTSDEGDGLLYHHGSAFMFATCPDDHFLRTLIQSLLRERGVETTKLPDGLRQRVTDQYKYLFNYGASPVSLPTDEDTPLYGEDPLRPGGVAIFSRGDVL